MSYNLSPLFNGVSQFDTSGNLLVGGKLYWYLAGTTTPVTVYKDNAGGASQTQPIILDGRGQPQYPIWLLSGQSYKVILTDANDVPIGEPIDNIVGINDTGAAAANSEWVTFAGAPTYVDATHFSVAGDQRTTFQQYRRVRATVTAGTVYGVISAAPSYAAGVTSVTVTLDSGSLDAGLTAVAVGILAAQSQSIPTVITRATTATKPLSVDTGAGAESAELTLNSPTGAYGEYVQLKHNSVLRWLLGNYNDDTFVIHRHDGSGVYVDRPFAIDPTTGAIRLNGKLIQIGTATVAGGAGDFSITFSSAFANTDYVIVCTGDHASDSAGVYGGARTTTTCTGNSQIVSSGAITPAPDGHKVYWIAIGA